jgi:hypothetical protein
LFAEEDAAQFAHFIHAYTPRIPALALREDAPRATADPEVDVSVGRSVAAPLLDAPPLAPKKLAHEVLELDSRQPTAGGGESSARRAVAEAWPPRPGGARPT